MATNSTSQNVNPRGQRRPQDGRGRRGGVTGGKGQGRNTGGAVAGAAAKGDKGNTPLHREEA